MKITKRQLRRIIKEQAAPPPKIEYQSDEWYQAWDALNEGLVNLVGQALDAGLIEDDLNDAWGETQKYVNELMRGGYYEGN